MRNTFIMYKTIDLVYLLSNNLRMTKKPVEYSDELADEICEAIGTDSKGIQALCNENPHWPTRKTIMKWIIKHPHFGDKYTKAKVHQVEAIVDEILDIADDTSRDTIIKKNKDGSEYEVCNTEWINRSRLRVDTRKWLASKLAPKIYGEKIQNSSPESQSLLQNLIDKL